MTRFHRLPLLLLACAWPAGATGQDVVKPTARVPRHEQPAPDADDVADVPAQDLRAGGDAKKRYLLIEPQGKTPPAEGYRLLIVMPGGDGGPGFHPFVKRICKNACSGDYIVAQVVAPEWSADQAEKLVWPTAANSWPGITFTTEDLVKAIIEDIERSRRLDARAIFTLSWSSSGPAAYAISLSPETRVRGSLVAMSVFKPAQLRAAGQAYYILHSPQDTICAFSDAKSAEQTLRTEGATVQLVTYQGGHGWRGDPFGMIRTGLYWLEAGAAPEAAP